MYWLILLIQNILTRLPRWLSGKESARNAGDPWVGKILWRRKWQPTPVLWPRKFHGWRSLVGYSPWGHKESDTTEQLNSRFTIRRSANLK